MIRNLHGDGGRRGIAWAMLSEKYKITDNLAGIRQSGAHPDLPL